MGSEELQHGSGNTQRVNDVTLLTAGQAPHAPPRPQGLLGVQNGATESPRRGPWQTGDHVTLTKPITKPAANLKKKIKISNIFGDT